MGARLAAAIALACAAGVASPAVAAGDPMIRYRTDDGTVVLTDDPAKVPPAYRDQIESAVVDPPGSIYRYRTGGRWAYTNQLSRVPTRARDRAELVDLAHISLNHDLTPELATAIDVGYREAQAAPACASARAEADASWPVQLWRERPAAASILGLMVLLAIATPIVGRRLLPGQWTRLLVTLMPALGAVALMAYAVEEMAEVKTSLAERAAPCRPDGLVGAASSLSAAEARLRHLDAMQQLIDEHAR